MDRVRRAHIYTFHVCARGSIVDCRRARDRRSSSTNTKRTTQAHRLTKKKRTLYTQHKNAGCLERRKLGYNSTDDDGDAARCVLCRHRAVVN